MISRANLGLNFGPNLACGPEFDIRALEHSKQPTNFDAFTSSGFKLSAFFISKLYFLEPIII